MPNRSQTCPAQTTAARQSAVAIDAEAGLRVVRILDAAQRSGKAQSGRITL
jgi:hypothetical protein